MTIGGIILAAGRSTRLGRPKAMLEIDGVPILTRLLEVYRAHGLQVVAVVSAEVEPLVPNGVCSVHGEPNGAMIDSLARGIAALPRHTPGAVIQPVDAPFTSEAMLQKLTEGAQDRPRVLTVDGKPGHPVYVPARLFDNIEQRPAGGLRDVIFDGMESIEWNTLEILADIDTEADVSRWL